MIHKSEFSNLARARKMAEMSDNGQYRLGCVAAIGRRVISVGWNSKKTHPVQCAYNVLRYDNHGAYYPPSVHAEVHCLASLRNCSHDIDFPNLVVYVARIRKNGSTAMARPCKACMAFIKSLGIRRVVYTTDSGVAEEYITEGVS